MAEDPIKISLSRHLILEVIDAVQSADLKATQRERDRLRELGQRAFTILQLDRGDSVQEAHALLKDGLNATPLDSPEGTAAGQAFEDRRMLEHAPKMARDRILELQQLLKRADKLAESKDLELSAAYGITAQLNRKIGALEAQYEERGKALIETRNKLDVAERALDVSRTADTDKAIQLVDLAGQAKDLREERDHWKRERDNLYSAAHHAERRRAIADEVHMFVSTGALVNGLGSGDDAYCDVCHNGPSNALHRRISR